MKTINESPEIEPKLESINLPRKQTPLEDVQAVYSYLEKNSVTFRTFAKKNSSVTDWWELVRSFAMESGYIWRYDLPPHFQWDTQRVFEKFQKSWEFSFQESSFLLYCFPELKNASVKYYVLPEGTVFLGEGGAATINKKIIILHPTSVNKDTLVNEAWAVAIWRLGLTEWLDRDKTELVLRWIRWTLRHWDELWSNAASIAMHYQEGRSLIDDDLFYQDIFIWLQHTYNASRIFLDTIPDSIRTEFKTILQEYSSQSPIELAKEGKIQEFDRDLKRIMTQYINYLKENPEIQRNIAQKYTDSATEFINWLRGLKNQQRRDKVFNQNPS